MSRIFPKLMPAKKIPARPDERTLRVMIRETCAAEATHALLILAGLGPVSYTHLADLLPVLTGKIRFDLTWLAEHYSVVIPDDQALSLIHIYQSHQAELRRSAFDPAVSADGVRVEVCANIGVLDDITDDTVRCADGVGLFRSEFLYLAHQDYPDEQTQRCV